MKGIVRPCRHRLGRDLHARWLAHLCGLCLSLRDTAGQSTRVLAGYDVLLLSVLTEAQMGRLPTTTAGACPLRGFRTAEVVDARTPAIQSGTAVALLTGGAGLTDKLDDGDAPRWVRPVLSRAARRLAKVGATAAEACGLDGIDLSAAPARARAVESRKGAGLDELLEPSGTAVAAMFAHTAVAAGVPANAAALRRAGDAFGRLVHLVDAATDRESDRRHGRFNPLEATATDHLEAGQVARSLHADISRWLGELELVDEALAEALFGPTLSAAVERVWGPMPLTAMPATPHPQVSPAPRRRGGALVGVAAALAAQAAIWGGGGQWGRGPRGGGGPWGQGPYGSNPYYGRPSYYGRRRGCGPSCGQMLACDCCTSCACSECCGADTCCCCI